MGSRSLRSGYTCHDPCTSSCWNWPSSNFAGIMWGQISLDCVCLKLDGIFMAVDANNKTSRSIGLVVSITIAASSPCKFYLGIISCIITVPLVRLLFPPLPFWISRGLYHIPPHWSYASRHLIYLPRNKRYHVDQKQLKIMHAIFCYKRTAPPSPFFYWGWLPRQIPPNH